MSSTPPSSSISNLLVCRRRSLTAQQHRIACPVLALHRDAKVPTLTMLRWARPVSRPRTWLFAAGSARPCRAARGSVDQGRLPRGSSVPLRWVPIPRNDSPLFAPAPHPGKNARQRAQLRPMPWKHPPPLGRAAIAPTIYGASDGPNLV